MSTAIVRWALAIAASSMAAGAAFAGAGNIDRSIGKQPTYRTAPRYGLLVFGPKRGDRIWLVRDGDLLYVDRNGNGDLTDPGEKILAENHPQTLPEEERTYSFNVGDITVGRMTHKGLRVHFAPLALLPQGLPHLKAALQKNSKAMVAAIEVEVDVPGLRGGGTGGRLKFMAGPVDLNGVLQFGDSPKHAPVVNVGGLLEVTFFMERPTLRAGRTSELTLVVGSPGVGAGTFATLAYEGTIPEEAKPTAEVRYQPSKPGEPPPRSLFEITERC
ncbi:MAG TPA: hypothetical protein VFA18_08535 [Gemmataceae bacterium]|nr:hypothetical protein [Gemmataceae bacterium]